MITTTAWTIVAVCLPDGRLTSQEVEGVAVHGNLNDVALAVGQSGADTVAVLGCPEMDGLRLRRLAWELEKTGTDLCVAPALLDVAGPRTTIRPVAGLPLLHVDHPELAGAKQVVKALFDKVAAAVGPAAARAALRADRGHHPASAMAAPCCSGRPGWARTAARSLSTSSAPW